ncbi:uncharacterized protein At5g08430-like [Salvia miltiorrhiza]|uniref:uncharacterized protein At5g08430-like n=1 Tax=Salvia miltiorrhiza TaxID=226208 RepID=UPI0025AD99E4|nr:uncharacterized protein At5g08430-like [Salvia miltiorrhiza]XP_057809205.1 uncharacterized protein At5g08430-like [Salvia miltiorrhiza]
MKSKGKKKKTVINKEEDSEDWCFVCKDGGALRICDHKECLKSYHPSCVEKDDSFLESESRWNCDWHTCSICRKSSNLHCYTCPTAVCRRCLPRAEFFKVKGQYGFCKLCLHDAILIEEKKDYDSDGNKMDFRDRETREGLFMEYYHIIKEDEGLEPQDLYAAKKGKKTKKLPESSSEEYEEEEEEDEISDYDDAEHVKKCRRTCSQKKSGRKNSGMKTPMRSSKDDFIGWGSRSLIDFLSSIGKRTDKKLSQQDVTSIVNTYVKENNLLHPEKRKMILCDARLQSLFRKKQTNKNKVYDLLEVHFAENYDESEKDELGYDSEDDDSGILDVCKNQRKLNTVRKSPKEELANNVPFGCFASIVVENVKLVYLRRSLLLELLKQPKSFAEKVVGCFIRVKSDPYDYCSRNSHQLIRVRGVRNVSVGQSNMEAEAILLISAIRKEISMSQLSDDDFSEEECEDLRRKVLAGQLERPTVEDLQQKANNLHVDLTKHWITKELALLQNRIDKANEKGWRRELFEYLEKKTRLQTPSEVSKLLESVPKVIPDPHELHLNSEDIVNDMSTEKDSPKSILRCNSSVTNYGWQDDNESEEKTRHCNASPPARKQSIFGGPDSEPEDDNITSRKAELEKDKLEGEESETTPHEQARRSSHEAVIEVLSNDENSNDGKTVENMEDLESEIWCLEDPTGAPRKFTTSALKLWSQRCQYASKFKVWKEGENEDNAVWLCEAFPKK